MLSIARFPARVQAKNLRKLERYRQSGFQLCVDLIVSQDTGGNPLSEREIDRLIDNFLV